MTTPSPSAITPSSSSSSASFPTTHTILPTPPHSHTHTLILLHGRGSNNHEFPTEFFESQSSSGHTLLELFPTVKWVFPGSKLRESVRFGGLESQWFDIWSVAEPWQREEGQREGLRESVSHVEEIVRKEAELLGFGGVGKVVLGGISMGCATGLHVLLNGEERLGGFTGLCGWLPFERGISGILAEEVERDGKRGQEDEEEKRWLSRTRCLILDGSETTASAAATDGDLLSSTDIVIASSTATKASLLRTPVFLSHSKDDDVVPVQNGEVMTQCLKRLGMDVDMEIYEDGAHWINEPQGVDDMVKFLRDKVGVPVGGADH